MYVVDNILQYHFIQFYQKGYINESIIRKIFRIFGLFNNNYSKLAFINMQFSFI
jgi:hypothetical protein